MPSKSLTTLDDLEEKDYHRSRTWADTSVNSKRS